MSGYENVGRQLRTTTKLRSPPQRVNTLYDKQRKWRVILSIGLLLPALAAIIGIVAWTISIEVANGGPESEALTSSSNLRKLHAHSLSQSHHNNHQHHHHHHQQHNHQQHKALAPAHRLLPEGARSEEAPALQPGSRVSASRTTPANARRRDAAAATEIAAGSVDAGVGFGAEAEVEAEVEAEAGAVKETETEGQLKAKSESAESESANQDDQRVSSLLLTSLDQVEALSGSTSLTPGSQDERKLEQMRNANHKSRWLEDRHQQNKRPITSSLLKTPKKTWMSEDEKSSVPRKQHSRPVDAKIRVADTNSKPNPNNKYTLVDKGDAHDASSSQTPIELLAEEEEQIEPEALGNVEGAQNTKSPTDSKKLLEQQDHDDELGFEAIASAISTTLSQSQPAGYTNKSVPPGQTLGDFGALDSSGNEQTNIRQLASQQLQRKRTPGEKVAEVIDHLVERRKQSSARSATMRGPQIVVVAPVGDGNLMKARSLTKADDKVSSKKAELNKSPVQIDKRISISMKVDKKPNKKMVKLLGARLLGGINKTPDASKFSERVEVIEDDDSSFLLNKSPERRSDEPEPEPDSTEEEEGASEAKNGEFVGLESVGELNEPDESTSELASSHVSSHSGEGRLRSPRHELEPSESFERYASIPRLQLLSARSDSPKPAEVSMVPAATTVPQAQPKLYSTEQLIREHVLKSKSKTKLAELNLQPTSKPSKSSAPLAKQAAQTANSPSPQQAAKQVAQQQREQFSTSPNSTTTQSPPQPTTEKVSIKQPQKQPEQQMANSRLQAVRVPLIVGQQYQPSGQHPSQSFHHRPEQTYQVMESQHNPNYQRPPPSQQQFAPSSIPQKMGSSQRLPQFPEQEYNVPAHMADSVIQDIQRSPALFQMVDGRPTLLRAIGPVPHHQQAQLQQFLQPGQHLQTQQSQQVAQFMPSPLYQQAMYLANQREAMSRAGLFARLAAASQQPASPQMLANRNAIDTPTSGASPNPVSVSVKSPRGLIAPVAQMALRHLFSSISQQPGAEPAAGDKKDTTTATKADEATQSRSMLPPGEPVQAESGERGARSLPVGALAPGPEMPVNIQNQISDQEIQESYGQVPTYQMADSYAPATNYGHPPSYGGGYAPHEEKKSKGITFHFGGGPIGGGTQLITSPMGIFKHLMIPLMPNPRVNLNGKVVFGVVLEKSTAFGEPKKKHKFWGR